ncbi:TauD/TfdA family dioxygenase [Frankia sp. CNm7]|uniref:TauD/TfdA family dioxygenase n=1 Tax=Frankia nepalensis TaxID=1836974 RepID=A0A937RJD0_9ACTN|nr:TauD/TfdA family dioxygenase [Frankia nepalensis]MBL7501184.1 TauD/TfdA family dioxygenase [Frankia nepalensis]MBL7515734.1 TauD/TfdA family dioxygenase [Frankia nepalensis]MBL7521802.1 TauD/TfdA family dioxygenase [Frankia nepalensis]MBL7631400.1 TauD/TfdA family dioxygenase [Frankia nepalensis]
MAPPTTTTTTELGIDVRPVAGNIGAEIHGVDLREELDDATVAEIRSALHRWKVVFFRDQHIDHAQQVAFGRRFGKLTPAHPHEDAPPEGHPEILPIDSRRYNKFFAGAPADAKKLKATYDNGWHTDVTALVNPPAGSILRAEIVPPYGGDTQWTNLVAAYEALPEPLARLADSLRAKHSFGQPIFEGSEYGKKIKANPLVAIHPVVRVHPETGERALFVSPSFTSRDNEIIDFGPRQSRAILDLFYEQISRPEFTVRFRWNPGDVAFWDNRATAHLGPSDVDITAFDRVLYRVTLEGDVPVGVDGRESELVAGQQFLGS